MKIGIDIVEIKRIKNIYQKFGLKFLYKIFTDNEISEIERISGFHRKIEKIAGKFAAKEAVIKACDFINDFKEVEVLTSANESPVVNNIENCEISISHEKNYAVAVAIFKNFIC